MPLIEVRKTNKLLGEVKIQGSKNTVLPIFAATLLNDGVSVIRNCPNISDVDSMLDIMTNLGSKIRKINNTVIIDNRKISINCILPSYTGKLRSSIILLGPLLARFNNVSIGYPGGCMIGARPIDIHLDGFGQMNVGVTLGKEFIHCETYYLKGTHIKLRFPSVGATQNLLMAATRARGTTVIENAAIEPEIEELAIYLVSMGAKITGVGSRRLVIEGVDKLNSADYTVIYDRIVAGTYMLAACSIESNIRILNIYNPKYLKNIIALVRSLGAQVILTEGSIIVQSSGKVNSINVETSPHPGIPTDLQSMILVVLSQGEREARLKEAVFENRFRTVPQLKKLGMNIEINDNIATVTGMKNNLEGYLKGATLKATDLRGGASFVLAGFLSEGTTTIENIQCINRGYEDIVRDFRKLGANIRYTD